MLFIYLLSTIGDNKLFIFYFFYFVGFIIIKHGVKSIFQCQHLHEYEFRSFGHPLNIY